MRRWAWAAVFAGGTVVFGMVAVTTWRHARDASRSVDNLARAAGGLGYGFAVGAGVLAAGMLALLVWQLRSRTYGSSPDPRFGIGALSWLLALVPVWSSSRSDPMSRIAEWAFWIWLLGGLWLVVASFHLVHTMMLNTAEPTASAFPNPFALWAPPALMCACTTALHVLAS